MESQAAEPDGLTIEAVEWLPSGGGTGLVRVRGRWAGGGAHPAGLPVLFATARSGAAVEHVSLPDPRAGRESAVWRGAYIVDAALVETGEGLALAFGGGRRVTLPAPERGLGGASAPSAPPPPATGGEVIDRAVLAERRARRAEAAEQAQARIAAEALKAVEILELRGAELEERLALVAAERDGLTGGESVEVLRERLAAAELRAVALRHEAGEAREAAKARLAEVAAAEDRASRGDQALGQARATAETLRRMVHGWTARAQAAEAARARDAWRLALLEARRGEPAAELAEVAQARDAALAERDALTAELVAVRARPADTLTERIARLERAQPVDREALADQARALTPTGPPARPPRLLADLDAAAAALRNRHPVATQPESAGSARPAPGTQGESPSLLRALVKLAHDDGESAARLLEGLLPAQALLLGPEADLDYDLTIVGHGTYAVTVAGGRAAVRRVEAPRSRARVDFRLSGGALAFAELLAGRGGRPRRFTGPVRLAGRRGRLARELLRPLARMTPPSLAEVVRAGAVLEPGDVLAALPYVIPPAWTRGHSFRVTQAIAEAGTWVVAVADGAPLAVVPTAQGRAADASVAMSRAAFDALLRCETAPAGERPRVRGDRAAVALLKAWTDRALGDPGLRPPASI